MNNAVLETYYADMNARQDQNIIDDKAEEQARVSAQYRDEFVDEIASAYTAAKEGTPRASVYTAIGTIAGYFYNPEGNVIPRGDEAEANALSFQQRGMLGNLVSNAKWMLDNARQHERKLIAQADELEAICDDSEISLNKLSFALDRLEDCAVVQIPACEEWFEVTQAAYEAVVGEAWKPFVKKGRSGQVQTADAVKERLAVLRARA
jgi:hypothetical protein